MNTRQSLYRAFQDAVCAHAEQIAVRDNGNLSYAELEAASRIAARAMIATGIQRGDRVMIWAGNRVEWIVAGLAIQAVGAVLQLASTRLRAPEVADLMRRSGTCLLICDPGFGDYDFVGAIMREDVPTLENVVAFDARWDRFLDRSEAIGQAALDARIEKGGPDDLADIIFTSGTTGKPKGVPMTHEQSLIACAAQQRNINRYRPGEVSAVLYPFAHNAGYRAGWQAGLLHGVTILPVRTYDPVELMAMIERERINILPVAPPTAQSILDHPDRPKYDLSSLRYCATGATTIPVRLIERMLNDLGAQQVATGYGLTEAAGSVSNTDPSSTAEIIATTTGKVLDNLHVRLLDREGRDVSQGEPGEICVKGPQVMHGYYDDPAATAAAFTPDGYLKTGDVGVFDAAGNLKITDRIKDMYLVGGFNCYPAEIEQMLGRMPGVARVAVVGVADERLGEVGRAFIVKSADATLDEAGVVAWCRNQMANYKVPRSVVFLDELPLNATGKVNKVALRAL